jgi:ADP-ribose pyrophosphatase YjhB (NUDIX family)
LNGASYKYELVKLMLDAVVALITNGKKVLLTTRADNPRRRFLGAGQR